MERLENWATRLNFAWAVAGGLVLIAVMAVTLAAIVGRALVPLGLSPPPGDFELVEAGTAVAIFAFLPWCHLQAGHVSVDLLSRRLGRRYGRGLALVSSALMLLVAALLAWRLGLGLGDKWSSGETSYILRFPLWWSYAGAFAGLCVFILAALAVFLRQLRGDGAQASGEVSV